MDINIKLRQIVEETDTRSGRFFDWLVLVLIVYSIVTLTIETLPNLSELSIRYLKYSEIVVTILFTIEYFLRIYAAKKRLIIL